MKCIITRYGTHITQKKTDDVRELKAYLKKQAKDGFVICSITYSRYWNTYFVGLDYL